MKISHYLAIGIRLFSIALFFLALSKTSIMIEVVKNNSINGVPVSIFFILGTLLYPLALSIFLWFFPFTISNLILRPEIDRPIEPMNAQSILMVLILFIGLYFLFYAIVDSIHWIVYWNTMTQSEYSLVPIPLAGESKANMVATVVELIMSIMIILNAKTLSFHLLKSAK